MNHLSNTSASRRGFLGLAAAASAGAVGAGSPAGHPDARLLELIQAYNKLQQHILDLYPRGKTPIADDDQREAAIEKIGLRQEPIFDEIFATPTRTLEGFKARARMFLLANPDELQEDSPYGSQLMLFALVHDLAG